MTARLIPIRSVDRDNEVVRRVYVKSSTTRQRDSSYYLLVKVGVSRGGSSPDWLGDWDQSERGLTAYERYHLTGDADLNFSLDDGDELVLYLEDFSDSVYSFDGMSVEVKGVRYGEVGDATIPRTDGEWPAAAVATSELFTIGADVVEPGASDAIDTLVETLNQSGVTDWEVSIPLWDA